MKKENLWSDRAKAPDPDDLSSEQPVSPSRDTGHHSGRTHVDYTAMAHHEEIPDSSDTGDPSRPQGEFWHRNERPGVEGLHSGWPSGGHPEQPHDGPVKLTPESLAQDERPTIFFVDLRHKS
jgi:hypothetical protein